ncbi:MAG: hypothetical protein JW724_04250 [Candidatus Altiarchaeota archaeon]|nr:hypothetical protein [Candidatus Altiarchaeota archaeon]
MFPAHGCIPNGRYALHMNPATGTAVLVADPSCPLPTTDPTTPTTTP